MLGAIWMTNILRIQILSLTKPEYRKATILITGDNFGGLGPLPEHAAWAFSDYGFKVVIAGSFGDITMT